MVKSGRLVCVFLAFTSTNAVHAQSTIQVEIPQSIDVDLVTLQKQIVEQGGTFEIGENLLDDLAIAELASTRPPEDLPIQASIQSGITRRIALATSNISTPEIQAGQFNDDRRLCNPASSSFDWREHNHVTPVRNQGRCGACWAFASMAAFEANNSIVNRSRIDGSEQDLLDCSGSYSCSGGWFDSPLIYLRDRGGRLESQARYTGVKGQCTPRVPANFGLKNWGYVERHGGMPSPQRMKRALCESGPLAVGVYATELYQRYKSGVFNEYNMGEGSSTINHGIVIVGWNDAGQYWITKNSWDTSWGEQGYMRIRYGSNNVGYGAVWSEALPYLIRAPEIGTDENGAVNNGLEDASLTEFTGLVEADSGYITTSTEAAFSSSENNNGVWSLPDIPLEMINNNKSLEIQDAVKSTVTAETENFLSTFKDMENSQYLYLDHSSAFQPETYFELNK